MPVLNIESGNVSESNPLPVAMAGGATFTGDINATPTTSIALTDKSGSITTGGTAQTLAAAKVNRVYLKITNISNDTLWWNETSTAVLDSPSQPIYPTQSEIFGPGNVPPGAISIIGATTGQKWVAKEA